MNAEPTFKGLLHSLTNPVERFTFEEYVPRYTNYISKVVIEPIGDDSLLKKSVIYFKSGYNCIIGKSGSGKSLLLHLINKGVGANTSHDYSNYDNEKMKITFYDEFNNVISPLRQRINVGNGESVFGKLIDATDATDTTAFIKIIKVLNGSYIKFSNYYKYKESYANRLSEYYELKKKYKDETEKLKNKINIFNANYKILKELSSLEILTIDNIPSLKTFEYNQTEMDTIARYKDNIK